jgi:hypothetical protein
VADRGYYTSEEILACEEAGITVTLPKPMTSNSKAAGRFGKQDFRYIPQEDVYICPSSLNELPLLSRCRTTNVADTLRPQTERATFESHRGARENRPNGRPLY